jgi:hypothetical protein
LVGDWGVGGVVGFGLGGGGGGGGGGRPLGFCLEVQEEEFVADGAEDEDGEPLVGRLGFHMKR